MTTKRLAGIPDSLSFRDGVTARGCDGRVQMAEETDERRAQEPSATARGGQARAFAGGLLTAFSVPAAVLFATALGFGALARDGGFTMAQTAFITASIFALPNQVVLVDQLARNETLFAAAFAVTLTAVRLLPMTASIAPLFKGPRRRPVLEAIAAHFVAVTPWIEGNRRLPSLAPDLRLAFYLGMGLGLSCGMVLGTLAGYALAGSVPPVVAAALLFMTPIYFLLSLLATSQSRMDLLAVGMGCALAPVAYALVPGFDLLATGLAGGTLAFLLGGRARRQGGGP
jgi:predicted branched-subunit amino acid permease